MKPGLGNIITSTTPIYKLNREIKKQNSFPISTKTVGSRQVLSRFSMFDKDFKHKKCLSCPNAR